MTLRLTSRAALRVLAMICAIVIAPAHAEQSPIMQPTTGPHSMFDLNNNYLNPALRSLLGSSSGVSAPTNGPSGSPVPYQWWMDTSSSPPTLRMYDGSQWVALATLNASAHQWNLTAQLAPIDANSIIGNANGYSAVPQALPLLPLSGMTRAQIATTTLTSVYQSFIAAGDSAVGDYGHGCAWIRGTSGGPRATQSADGAWWNLYDAGPGVDTGCFGQTSGDSTVAVQAALDAFNHVIISHDTKLGSISVTTGGKFVECSAGAGIFATSLTTDVFNFHNDVAHPVEGARISGCRFFPDVAHGSQQTAGSYVVFQNCFNCYAEYLELNQPFDGVFVYGANTNGVVIDKIRSVGPAHDSIVIAGGVEIKIDHTNMFGGSGHCGINIQQASGFYINNTGASNTGNGVCINPASGGYVEFGFIANSALGDLETTAVGVPIVAVDGSRVSDINFVNNWTSSSDTGLTTACTGSGIIKNITIKDHRAFTNFKSAIDLGCGSYIDITGRFGNNSYTSAGTYPAIKVRPGVDHWSVKDSTFATIGPPAYVQTQGWAIVVDAGSGSTYQITHNDLSNGYTITGIADNNLGANRTVQFNTPNTWDAPLPDGTAAVTQSASDNSTKVATTAFVQSAIPSAFGVVTLSDKRTCSGDDTSEITAAITRAGANGTVQFPDGSCHILTAGVVGRDKQRFVSPGSAELQYNQSSGAALTLKGDRAMVKGLRFTNSLGASPGTSVAVQLSDGVENPRGQSLYGVSFLGFNQQIVRKSGELASIQECDMYNAKTNAIVLQNLVNGDSGDIKIVNCDIYADTGPGYGVGAAIVLNSGGGLYIANTKILQFVRAVDLQVDDGVTTSDLFISSTVSFENPTTECWRLGRSGTTGVFEHVSIHAQCLGGGGTMNVGISSVTLGGIYKNGSIAINILGGSRVRVEDGTVINNFSVAGVFVDQPVTEYWVSDIICTSCARKIYDGHATPANGNEVTKDSVAVSIASAVTYTNIDTINMRLDDAAVLIVNISGIVQGVGPALREVKCSLTTDGASNVTAACADTLLAGAAVDYQVNTGTAGSAIIGVRRNSGGGGTSFDGKVRVEVMGDPLAFIRN